MTRASLALFAVVAGVSCYHPRDTIPAVPVAALPGHAALTIDTAPKAELRVVPAEAYVRTYLTLFGALAPLDVQKKARGAEGAQLFDTWSDYLATLGLPDHKLDFSRANQTNALMLGTFERLSAALCDRAVEHDLRGLKPRVIFDFDLPSGVLDASAFEVRFDVLHRTFLGYPARLARKARVTKYFTLYQATVARHEAAPPPKLPKDKPKLAPKEAGWAVVCEGLVRHPEFQLY